MRKLVCTLLFGIAVLAAAQTPSPLPNNPGNIFIEGQEVSVPVEGGSSWKAVDENGKSVAQGAVSGGRANLGKQPVGFYSIRIDGARHDITAAVVAAVNSPRPFQSPIGVNENFLFVHREDPASWKWQEYASIVALTGVAWERDVFRWREVQPQKGGALHNSVWDEEPAYMRGLGVHVLDTMLAKPEWLTENENFPSVDLREPYNSFREIAARWRGKVDAFEPMNEWDIKSNGAELASYLKAFYLGVKAGNPDALVGTPAWSNAMVPQELQEFDANDASAYFDSVNFHHYLEPDQLPSRYKVWTQLAHGKELWVDEFNLHMAPVEDEGTGDPSAEEMAKQAQEVAKLYATVLYLGSGHAFYFTLHNHIQNGKQWGLLHPDLTPRPGYVALAAVARYLADAKIIGKLTNTAYAFHASPGGTARDVVVAWGRGTLNLPAAPVEAYDYMGRKIPSEQQFKVPQTPVFIVLAQGSISGGVTPPPPKERATTKSPSPVVMQAAFTPDQRTFLRPEVGPPRASASVANVRPDQTRVFIYNFSNKTLNARVTVETPSNAEVSPATVSLPPMCRIPLKLSAGGGGSHGEVRVHATGDFEDSVLVFHVGR